jgi:predicted Zn-dependent peptidase
MILHIRRGLTIPIVLLTMTAMVQAQNAFAEIQSHVTDFTLANGMRVLVLERHEAPVASFFTYADVGSAQETKGITGLAHMFEHMAFKGSTNIGTTDYASEQKALDRVDQAVDALLAERSKGSKADPNRIKQLEADFAKAQEEAGKFVVRNEFGEAIERSGGRGLNASTSDDATVYFYNLPSNEAELWFWLESERFLRPVFREFYKERDVVIEERRLSVENQPIGKLIEEFLSVAYKAHPYGEPTIGHLADLQSFTRSDAQAFFQKYYVPGNLTAVVVGDVDPKRIRELAEKYFGRIPSRPQPAPLRTVEPPQVGERRVKLWLQSQPLIVIGYHRPDINHPDSAVYNAIGSLLSEGRSSRLQRALVQEKKIAVDSGGFSGLPGQKYPGLFLFYAITAQGHTNDECETALESEINRLKTALVSPAELAGVKRRARANLLRSLDSNSLLAQQLGTFQGLTGDWRNLFKSLDKIDAVTAEDVKRVANVAFTRDNRTIGSIESVEAK